MDLQAFTQLLDRQPVVVTNNLPAVGLIPNVELVEDFVSFQARLDAGELEPERRYVVLHGNAAMRRRFRVANPSFEPFGPALSDALFDRIDVFRRLMLTQDRVPERVLASASKDVVVLVVVDGLSYRDCRGYSNVEPCLVPGVSKTREGYRRSVGQPTVGHRMVRNGFNNLLGFSYWDREDDLEITNEIFVPFGPKHLNKVRRFDDVLGALESHPLRKTYVQVVIHGLDYLSHKASDEPLVEEHVLRVFTRLEQIAQVLRRKQRRGSIFMTADHGILWRTQHDLQKIAEPAWSNGEGIRYIHGKIVRPYFRHDSYDGAHYSLLRYPYILRNLGPTEWGVHGGVSYEESIVPFCHLEV